MRGSHGNVYRYNDADHKHRMGHCGWLPKDGDLCLRVRDSGDCFHDYVSLRETKAGKWEKVGEFGAYVFGDVVCKLDDRQFHLACAGEPISLPNAQVLTSEERGLLSTDLSSLFIMKYEYAKIERLTKTMNGFFKKRQEENCCWRNGRLPAKQRKAMISLIRQAKEIDENSL